MKSSRVFVCACVQVFVLSSRVMFGCGATICLSLASIATTLEKGKTHKNSLKILFFFFFFFF